MKTEWLGSESGNQWGQSWQSIIKSEPLEYVLSLILFNILINVLDDKRKHTLSKFAGYASPEVVVDTPEAHPASIFITRGILTGWRNETTDIS